MRQPKMQLEPHRLVFPLETETAAKMTCLRGRRPDCQKFLAKAHSDSGRSKPSRPACDAKASSRPPSSTRQWTGASSQAATRPNWRPLSNRAISSCRATYQPTGAPPPRRPSKPEELRQCLLRPTISSSTDRDNDRKTQGASAGQSPANDRGLLSRILGICDLFCPNARQNYFAQW